MMRVMVVEDEEMIRKGIVMAVDWAALDCIVVGEAANGEQALAVAEDCQPTLIITDLKMPKMDGLEMVRRLREAGSRTYVIILTAYDSFAYAQTAIRLGAVDFLLKPFHDGDLENAVLALQKRIAAQTAPQPEPLPGVKPGPKSRYVRGISHELRTPLNTILGYCQIMSRDADLPRRRRDAVARVQPRAAPGRDACRRRTRVRRGARHRAGAPARRQTVRRRLRRPRELGHGRECAGHGLRQYGR